MAMVKSDTFQLEPYSPGLLPTPKEMGAMLLRQRWVVLATCILVALAMGIAGLWTPQYVAQMKILVLRQRIDAVISPEVNSPVQWGGDQVSEEDLNTEVELLRSTDLMRKVVVETGLDHGHTAGSTPDKAIAAAVRELNKHLKVEAIRKTNMISVQYESRDPKMASRVLSALYDAYSEKHKEVHRPAGELKFFDEQAAGYKKSIADLQGQILQFKQQTGSVAPQEERDQAVQRENEFDASAHQAQQAMREDNDRIRVLRAQLATMQPQVTGSLRTTQNDALIGTLKGNLNTLELKRTEMLGRYAPTYRPIQDLDAQIAELKTSIAKEMATPLHDQTTTANPVYQWAQQELARSQAEVGSMRARASSATGIADQYRVKSQGLNQQSVQLEDLVREEKAQEENYLLYMHKREEARSSDALDRRGIVNVAIAQHPVTPAFPVRTVWYVLGMTLLLCLIASASSAFVSDTMAQGFRDADEVVRYLNVPLLACLPKAEPV